MLPFIDTQSKHENQCVFCILPVPGGSVVAEAARVWMIGEVTAAAAGLDAVGPKELETGESASVDSRAEGVACGGSDEGWVVGDSCMSTTLRCSSRACEPISRCNRHTRNALLFKKLIHSLRKIERLKLRASTRAHSSHRFMANPCTPTAIYRVSDNSPCAHSPARVRPIYFNYR
jgi:hypothetical protein